MEERLPNLVICLHHLERFKKRGLIVEFCELFVFLDTGPLSEM